MNNLHTFMIALVCFVILYESSIGVSRKFKRRRVFEMAKRRSKEIGLPLLVIGDPYNGLMSITTGAEYECGDVCLDLTGCTRCPNGIKGKLEELLQTLKLDDYVVYISCVLEYVDDLELILSYLTKMNHKNLFIVNVEWFSLTAYFYPYFLTNEQPPKYIIIKCPPWSKDILYTNIK